MTIAISHPASPEFPPSSRKSMDAALALLQEKKTAWAGTSVRDRIRLLEELTRSFLAVTGRWADACIAAEGLDPVRGHAEEALSGPYFILRNLRLLRLSLLDLERHGRPRIPGAVRTRPDGQVTARVFPCDVWDSIFYGGVTGDVWMEPGVTAEGLAETQAVAYRAKDRQGGVAWCSARATSRRSRRWTPSTSSSSRTGWSPSRSTR